MNRVINSIYKRNLYLKNNIVRCLCIDVPKTKDLYGILGVRPSATQGEIKQAYYNLTLVYHPDRNDGSHEAAMKFREVTEAYEILGNSLLRQRYDMDLPMIKPRTRDIKEEEVKYQKFFDSRNAVLSGKKPADTYEEFFDSPREKLIKPASSAFPPFTVEQVKSEKRLTGIILFTILMYVCYIR